MSTHETTIAELRAENRRLRTVAMEAEQVAHDLRQERDEALMKLSVLERRIEQMRKRIYGWSSERHHPGQQNIDLGIAQELPAVSLETTPTSSSSSSPATQAAQEVTESPADPPAAPAAKGASVGKRPQAGRHPGRRSLPLDSEVVIEEVTIPEHERLDEHGQPLPLLGYRTSDKWDYRRGAYLIRRYRRAIYGRPFSDSQDRIVAQAPACLIPQGKMTDAALIHTVVEKFADHLPLYRQQQRAWRTGIYLSRSTLVTHVTAVAAAVRPIYDVLSAQIRAARYLHLDDTPVKVMDPGRGHTATARIWVYRSEQEAVFQYTETREGRHPALFLGPYRGAIVADAYAGHERLYGLDLATAVGCWAHVRRKFYELLEQEPFARSMVEQIQLLYLIEDDLMAVGDEDTRREVRQRRTAPFLTQMRARLDHAYAAVLPASALGRAIAYALKRWDALTVYADSGFLPIDNNPAENALRPWAIGRKNWLFFGSSTGGERAAVVATMIENCRQQGLDPHAYLLDTVGMLQKGCTDYASLTPRVYAQKSDQAIA